MPTVSFNNQFPGYEILSELGRSNARILKAKHQATGELVAIKHFALNTDADTLHRFQREARIMTQIRDHNVVQVKEVCLEATLPFIVMELIEGGDLRSLLENGNLDASTTIRLGLQMVKAFNAIHPKGIVHRDVKPENILYRLLPSGEFHFLLTDFGIASALIASEQNDEYRTKTGHSLLTYEYASPEQFDNPRKVGSASDYYSLGVVLYECLSGKVPFAWKKDVGMATFMNQVISITPPELQLVPAHNLPKSLSEVLSLALLKNPAERLIDSGQLELLLGQAHIELLQSALGGITQPPAIDLSTLKKEPSQTIIPSVSVKSNLQPPPKNVVPTKLPSNKPVLVSIDGIPVKSLVKDVTSSHSQLTTIPSTSTQTNENSKSYEGIIVSILVIITVVSIFYSAYRTSSQQSTNYTSVTSDSTSMMTDSTMAMDSASLMATDSSMVNSSESRISMADTVAASTATVGKVVFWTQFEKAHPKIYIDGEYKGILIYPSTTGVKPSCDDVASVTAELSTGKHEYRAESEPDKDGQVWTWNKTIFYVTEGQCETIELGK